VPKAEFMGYADPTSPTDKNATVVMGSELTGSPALTVFNSTVDDLVIGYSSKTGATLLKKSDCDLFLNKIEHNSFVFHSGALDAATKKTSLPLGTIGIFEQGVATTSELFVMPASVFGGQGYTVEIYQDNDQARAIGLQACMSVHDVPSGRVRDITPVSCMFWYQSVAQLNKKDAKGMVDLPGQVWVVSQGDDETISFQVPLGTAMQFDMIRPALDKKRWIYCIYVDPKGDDAAAAKFIQNFIAGTIGADIIAQYEEQSINQFNEIQQELSQVLTFSSNAKGNAQDSKKIVVPETLLQAAIEGALKVNRGQIQDQALHITGYLLGADVFLPQGIGATSTLYYQLNPSQQTAASVPTSSMINGYTMGITSAPKAMPAPTVYAASK
jgi:hypothetical protein